MEQKHQERLSAEKFAGMFMDYARHSGVFRVVDTPTRQQVITHFSVLGLYLVLLALPFLP